MATRSLRARSLPFPPSNNNTKTIPTTHLQKRVILSQYDSRVSSASLPIQHFFLIYRSLSDQVKRKSQLPSHKGHLLPAIKVRDSPYAALCYYLSLGMPYAPPRVLVHLPSYH